jgi:hypothetical protein
MGCKCSEPKEVKKQKRKVTMLPMEEVLPKLIIGELKLDDVMMIDVEDGDVVYTDDITLEACINHAQDYVVLVITMIDEE